jgi:hypothetical protein
MRARVLRVCVSVCVCVCARDAPLMSPAPFMPMRTSRSNELWSTRSQKRGGAIKNFCAPSAKYHISKQCTQVSAFRFALRVSVVLFQSSSPNHHKELQTPKREQTATAFECKKKSAHARVDTPPEKHILTPQRTHCCTCPANERVSKRRSSNATPSSSATATRVSSLRMRLAGRQQQCAQ